VYGAKAPAPASDATQWPPSGHVPYPGPAAPPSRHAWFLSAGFTIPALLRAANVRFWVTMWPRSIPVSAASATRYQALTTCHTMTRAALASPCATGGVGRAMADSKPAAAASWWLLRAVNDVWCVKSPA